MHSLLLETCTLSREDDLKKHSKDGLGLEWCGVADFHYHHQKKKKKKIEHSNQIKRVLKNIREAQFHDQDPQKIQKNKNSDRGRVQ